MWKGRVFGHDLRGSLRLRLRGTALWSGPWRRGQGARRSGSEEWASCDSDQALDFDTQCWVLWRGPSMVLGWFWTMAMAL